MKMECPYLFSEFMLSCKADLGSYVPSLDELAEYCKTTRHPLCPFYCIFDKGPE